MKAFGPVLFLGVAGLAVMKVLAALLFPAMAILAVLGSLALKLALVSLGFYLVMRLFRGRRPREA